MTPTPQERTEQDALALARVVLHDQRNIMNVPATGTTGVLRQLASALLSLAAQSEELRAELEKERGETEQRVRGGWDAATTYRQQAEAFGADLKEERESRRILESRYSALVKASREFHRLYGPDPKFLGWPTEGHARAEKELRRILLDSEASGQGVSE